MNALLSVTQNNPRQYILSNDIPLSSCESCKGQEEKQFRGQAYLIAHVAYEGADPDGGQLVRWATLGDSGPDYTIKGTLDDITLPF